MFEKQIARYRSLNSLAEQGGIVIFGCGSDVNIPLGELRQAFSIESRLYNRSIEGLRVSDAIRVYDECVAPLSPDTVLLHLGAEDVESIAADNAGVSAFDQNYRALIGHIRECTPDCNVVIISVANYTSDARLAELNRHLSYIAQSEDCRFGDISSRRVWNPRETKSVMSFVSAWGLGRCGEGRKPLYDLVNILFCSTAEVGA